MTIKELCYQLQKISETEGDLKIEIFNTDNLEFSIIDLITVDKDSNSVVFHV